MPRWLQAFGLVQTQDRGGGVGRESRAAVLGGGSEYRASGWRWRGELSAHHGDVGMSVGGVRWLFLWASLLLSLPGVGDRHTWRRVS